jgi:DNA polymerase V
MKKKELKTEPKLEFYKIEESIKTGPPLYLSKVAAGFPSPADDYVELKLDLNKFLIQHPSATFYVKVKGDSMKNGGINDGDILVVDRSLEPRNNHIAVCILDGEFTVKKLKKIKDKLFLIPENPDFEPINVTERHDFKIWGIVSYIIHKTP